MININSIDDAKISLEINIGWEEVVNSRGDEFVEISFRDGRFHAIEESSPSLSGTITKKRYPITTISKNKETGDLTIFTVGDISPEYIDPEEAAKVLYKNRERIID